MTEKIKLPAQVFLQYYIGNIEMAVHVLRDAVESRESVSVILQAIDTLRRYSEAIGRFMSGYEQGVIDKQNSKIMSEPTSKIIVVGGHDVQEALTLLMPQLAQSAPQGYKILSLQVVANFVKTTQILETPQGNLVYSAIAVIELKGKDSAGIDSTLDGIQTMQQDVVERLYNNMTAFMEKQQQMIQGFGTAYENVVNVMALMREAWKETPVQGNADLKQALKGIAENIEQLRHTMIDVQNRNL